MVSPYQQCRENSWTLVGLYTSTKLPLYKDVKSLKKCFWLNGSTDITNRTIKSKQNRHKVSNCFDFWQHEQCSFEAAPYSTVVLLTWNRSVCLRSIFAPPLDSWKCLWKCITRVRYPVTVKWNWPNWECTLAHQLLTLNKNFARDTPLCGHYIHRICRNCHFYVGIDQDETNVHWRC